MAFARENIIRFCRSHASTFLLKIVDFWKTFHLFGICKLENLCAAADVIAFLFGYCHVGLRDLLFYLVVLLSVRVCVVQKMRDLCLSFTELRLPIAQKWNNKHETPTRSTNQHETEIKSRVEMRFFFIFRLRFVFAAVLLFFILFSLPCGYVSVCLCVCADICRCHCCFSVFATHQCCRYNRVRILFLFLQLKAHQLLQFFMHWPAFSSFTLISSHTNFFCLFCK